MKTVGKFLVMIAAMTLCFGFLAEAGAVPAYKPPASQKRAREIMGKNFFGVEDAIKHYKVNPTPAELDALSKVPFAEATLKECKDTHILVAVFPLSIVELRGLVDRKLFFNHENAWYNEEAFAKDKGQVGWQLVRKTHVENSMEKTWNEQLALLGKDEEVPTARVFVYAIISQYLVTGEQLFHYTYVRTADAFPENRHIRVGIFDWCGLDIQHWWDGFPEYYIGLASAKKPVP